MDGVGARGADVAVIVPAFNAAGTLARAVSSVFAAADGVRVEVVIVDDGSTDGTGAVARALVAGDARVRVVTQVNQGLSAARNAGLDAASASVPRVVFLDADDELLPGGLGALVRAMDRGVAGGGRALAAVGGFVMRNASGEEIGRERCSLASIGLDELLGLHFMIVPAVMLDAGLAREERFDPGRRRVEDYDLWLRLALRDDGGVRFVCADADVCAYHLSPGTMSTDFEGMLRNGQEVVSREFEAARGARAVQRGVSGGEGANVDASDARRDSVLGSLAMAWATRAAVVGGVDGAERGVERACALLSGARGTLRMDAERAAGHAVSAIRMGLAITPRVGEVEPVWLRGLLAWWRVCEAKGWTVGSERSEFVVHALDALAARLVAPEAVADAMLDAAGPRVRGVVVAGYRANGAALVRRALARGMLVRVRDERGNGAAAVSLPEGVEREAVHACVERGWALMLTNSDLAAFGAAVSGHAARGGCVVSWYDVREQMAARGVERLRGFVLRSKECSAVTAGAGSA